MRISIMQSAVTFAILVAATLAAAKNSDSAYTITAYHLTPEQEVEFSQSDGLSAPFWASWDSNGALSRGILLPSRNYAWGPLPASDAVCQLQLRIAYGQKGIYLLIEKRNNFWGCTYIPVSDTIHLFGANRPAADLYSRSDSLLPCMGTNQLSPQSFWLELPIPSCDVADRMRMNTWRGAVSGGSQCSGGLDSILIREQLTFEAATQRGIEIDVPPAGNGVSSLECLVRWSSWGGQGDPVLNEAHRGDRLALSFGLLDINPALQAAYTALCWRNGALPYVSRVDTLTGDTTSVDCWGDILFGEPLDSAVALASAVRQPVHTRRAQALGTGARAEYFSVTGRMVDVTGATVSSHRAPGLVLVRTSASGALSRRVLLGR